MLNKERDQIDYSINFIVCIVYGYCGPNKDFGQKNTDLKKPEILLYHN